MVFCKTLTLARKPILSLKLNSTLTHFNSTSIKPISTLNFQFLSLISLNTRFRKVETCKTPIRRYSSVGTGFSLETDEYDVASEPTLDSLETSSKDNVEELLTNKDDVTKLMKMNRRTDSENGIISKKWFPYLDEFSTGEEVLNSGEVLEALDPYVMEVKKARFKNVVRNRSYSVCLVVEGLRDFGNASATFRSADALGFQSVHVISSESSKRYRESRHGSMGAEKWLDIEVWDSTQHCFEVLKSRGYRIATTYIGEDTVSIYDIDWSCPTAIVVGNENMGISDEALKLSDLCCSIPMKGMVDSFNVAVAAGILMQHAACDRTKRLGHHGDLTLEERQILLAEFSLRHNKNAISIALDYANRKAERLYPQL